MKLLASWSSDAGNAWSRSFISASDSCVARRRSTGSAISVCSSTPIRRMRLPNVPCCSGLRTETGICAINGSSPSSWCSSNQRRTAPAQIDTTTSLTVTPWMFLASLTASSGSRPKTMRRCAETLPLNDVCGGVQSLRPLTIGLRRSAACMRRPAAPTRLAPGRMLKMPTSSKLGSAAGIERSRRSGYCGAPIRPRASISSCDGIRSAVSSTGSGAGRPSGVRSSSEPRISAPDRPSITAWCTLVISATRPCSRPWIR